jgi:hypothetical protein
MCVSAGPTKFSSTVTGVYEAAANLHVAFYGNTVARDPGAKGAGNALLLPIFGEWESIAAIDLTDAPHVLKDIAEVLKPRSRGAMSFGIDFGAKGIPDVIVEEVGIYTIVRAKNAGLICDAVAEIDARKRPDLNRKLFTQLAKWYKNVPFAVCCFSNEDEAESQPIAFSYKPLDADEFRIYMLDAHDGGVPKLNEEVDVDHTIFAGSYRMAPNRGAAVYYEDNPSAAIRALLPTQVVGHHFAEGTRLINGDVVVSVEDVLNGKFNGSRVVPPNARARKPVALSRR